MKVAAIQHDIDWEDGTATRKRVTPLIAQAAAAGARLIALTEMYATGFSMRPDRIAEDEGGPSEQFLVDKARQHGCWLVGSVAQRSHDGQPRNVAVLAAPDGTVHRYAKIHPFSYAGEHERYAAGTEFLTVAVEGVNVSVFVCYDLRFADEFWQLADSTDVYLVPANWPEARRLPWTTLLQARAIENQAYVIGCNRVGSGNGIPYSGDSRIIDPLGEVLASAAQTESILLADITAERVAEVRDRFRFLQDRR
jgi:predicted amidohydrolase